MTTFVTEIEGADGWSRWVTPVETGYKLACCDCGLVHDIDFRIKDKDGEPYIQFRAHRNNRSTGQYRRFNNITVKTS